MFCGALTCADCGGASHPFLAADDLWERVVGEEERDIVLCLDCFAARADTVHELPLNVLVVQSKELIFRLTNSQPHRGDS